MLNDLVLNLHPILYMTAVNALSSMMSLVHLYMYERLAYFFNRHAIVLLSTRILYACPNHHYTLSSKAYATFQQFIIVI